MGDISTRRCRTLYLEREYSGSIYKHDISFKLETYPDCCRVICPPKHMGIQRSCTIKLGPPSVGPTIMKITTGQTLEPCDRGLRLTGEHIKESISHTLNASFIEHWPFGMMNISFQRYNTGNVTHNFEFLHSAMTTLMLLCSERIPRKQMAVYVGTSQCKKINENIFFYIANHITVLTDSCMQMTYKSETENTNYNIQKYKPNLDFIYKGDGRVNTGHHIYVEYTVCPAKCRNLNYSVSVRSKDSSIIIEYTAKVGYMVYTGHYHKGFRVTITPLTNDCVFKEMCHMELKFSKPHYPIGTKDYDLGLYYFDNKR